MPMLMLLVVVLGVQSNVTIYACMVWFFNICINQGSRVARVPSLEIFLSVLRWSTAGRPANLGEYGLFLYFVSILNLLTTEFSNSHRLNTGTTRFQ